MIDFHTLRKMNLQRFFGQLKILSLLSRFRFVVSWTKNSRNNLKNPFEEHMSGEADQTMLCYVSSLTWHQVFMVS